MIKLLAAVAIAASLSACGGGDAHTYVFTDEERDTRPPVEVVDPKPAEETPAPAPIPPVEPKPMPKPDIVVQPKPDPDRGQSCEGHGKGRPPHC